MPKYLHVVTYGTHCRPTGTQSIIQHIVNSSPEYVCSMLHLWLHSVLSVTQTCLHAAADMTCPPGGGRATEREGAGPDDPDMLPQISTTSGWVSLQHYTALSLSEVLYRLMKSTFCTVPPQRPKPDSKTCYCSGEPE